MLVLSRRTDQKILFPSLGISLNVLRIKGSVVKIGVDAPRDVKVLRDEVAVENEAFASEKIAAGLNDRGLNLTPSQRHELNNELSTANIALHLTRRQIQAGQNEAATETLEKVVTQLDKIESRLAELKNSEGTLAKHALIVEDDDNERELLAGFLRFCGMTVSTAANGKEALEILEDGQTEPDFVLLDMNMPVCNGPEFIERIKESDVIQSTRIIGVTGSDPSELGLEADQAISRWYSKPFNPEVLVDDLTRESESGTAMI